MKPTVSVIIPNYNYAHYVREAVESVLEQTYQPLEIIVVDDGSKDDSIRVLEEFGKRTRLIAQSNAGVSASRNHGVAESVGDFVAFLDADDSWHPEKVARQVEMFDRFPDLGLVHVGVQDVDADGGLLEQHLNGLDGDVSERLLLFEEPVILGGGSGILVRRSVFDEVGGFDLRLSTSADWDFCYQVSRRYKVAFVNELLLRYRIHGSNMHSNISVMEDDMLLGFQKAFSAVEPNARELRKRAYSNLYRVLAGSYYHAGNYTKFLGKAIQSIKMNPRSFSYFAMYPLRRLNSK